MNVDLRRRDRAQSQPQPSVVSAEARTPPVQRRSASEVSALRGEIANVAERLDTSQEELNSPVRGARCVAGKLVASKLNLVEGQAALGAPKTKVTSASESAAVVLGVVGSVEGSAGVLLKTLKAVPL
jgi:hypothetical protein